MSDSAIVQQKRVPTSLKRDDNMWTDKAESGWAVIYSEKLEEEQRNSSQEELHKDKILRQGTWSPQKQRVI